MAFIDSTSDQRVELLRQAEKTANLTRRVTVGSGVLGVPEGVEGGELCTALSEALADIGYGGLPPGGAMVNGGEEKPVMALGGTPLVTGSTLVEDGVFEGIELPETAAVVQNTNLIQVREFNNTSIVSSSCPATVSANGVSYVSLPTGIGVLTNSGAVVIQSSTGTVVGSNGTAVVSGGKVSAIRLPATSAPVTNGSQVVTKNSTGTVTTAASSTVTVSGGALSEIRLAATSAIVNNGLTSTTIPVTGTFTTSVAFTVAGGVITGITLS